MASRILFPFETTPAIVIHKPIFIFLLFLFSIFQAMMFFTAKQVEAGVVYSSCGEALISYNISGATSLSSQDSEGTRTNTRRYEGKLESGVLKVSGVAKTGADTSRTWLYCEIRAGRAKDSWHEYYAQGANNKFSLSVNIPEGATKGSFSISLNTKINLDGRNVTYHSAILEGEFTSNSEENRPPVVTLNYSPENPIAGEKIHFTAEASDPDGDPLTYEWYLNGDKQPAGTSSVTLNDPSEGQHTLRVVVSDGRGGTDEDSVTFEVAEKEDIVVGVSYKLGYEFPPDADQVFPLLLAFSVEEGPPGTYISDIGSITQGGYGTAGNMPYFHSGECFGPADPILDQPTQWECGYEGITWPDLLATARNQDPVIPFKAQVEVFAGYDGSEMVFETLDVEFKVRLDGIASVLLMPPHSGDIIHERYHTADAELLDEGGNYMQTDNPLPVGQWKLVKPGQRIRVYQQTQVVVRCLSGMMWLIHREGGPARSWDYVIGDKGVANLSNYPVPANKSYVEHSVKVLVDEKITGPAKKKVVTRLLGVGKTAAGRALGVLGFVMNETPAGGYEVYAVRMRSEMVIDFHADGSITARTLKGAPDLIGTDGIEVPLPAGYETIMEEGTGRFSAPVPHSYDDAEELLPVPREFTSGESDTRGENDGNGSSGSDSSSGCFIGTLEHLR